MHPKQKSAALHTLPVPAEVVEQRIFFVRGSRVMVDRDLAELYRVSTKALNQAVKRNWERFPEDFMFRLTREEAETLMRSRSQIVTLKTEQNLRSQIVTSSWGGSRYRPYVFTEHGAVMLASVLNSAVAVQASIRVVRAFIRLRELLTTHKDLALKLQELERKYDKHDAQIKAVFQAIRNLMEPPRGSRRPPIGF